MHYYYLDATKTPQGPYTLDELKSMARAGRLSATTLIAAKGDTRWSALANHLFTATHVPQAERFSGPSPASANGMAEPFEPVRRSMLAHFAHCLRHYADFSGRATRAEYWSFVLIIYILNRACYILFLYNRESPTPLPPDATEHRINTSMSIIFNSLAQGQSTPIFWYNFFNLLLMLVTFLPACAVLVRRLHDAGRSGGWLLLTFWIPLLDCIPFPLTISQDNILIYLTLLLTAIIPVFIIILFVMTLIDSKPGPNQYGPATKYP